LADAPLLRSDPAYLCQHVLRQLRTAGIALDALPQTLSIDIDSRAGFDAGNKLGLGTSAAICATLTGALLKQCGSPTRLRSPHPSANDVFPLALAAHRAAQGGRGSGVDVAAVCHGGLIRYETTGPAPRVTRLALPAGVAFAAIWTGASADTRSHIADFDRWRDGTIPSALAQLIGAAAAVVGSLPNAEEFVRQLRAYAITLQALDATARLGIYSTAHRTLTDVARKHGVVYKPCGAGGGDVGMAFALEPGVLAAFERDARAAGFNRLPLELDEHGITVSVER
jgi:phosphomevalonate kinase